MPDHLLSNMAPSNRAAAGSPACVPQTLEHRHGSYFGRYRIVRTLGHGGMGAVYLAHDTQLDRSVALKIPDIPPGSGRDVLERFYREARAAAALHHPNLCAVYDVGQVDGCPYLTMAYIEGKPLSALIGRGAALAEHQVAAVIRKLALALQEAHDHNVVHRDLKPANILVSRKGELVIVDFGLARRYGAGDAQVTNSGLILGTPAYMSPEQIEGSSASMGPACDIYSLGVILYEMLSGRVPFEGSAVLVLCQILGSDPEPLSQLRPDVDPRLEAICCKAMAKRVSDRYATMRDLAGVLGEYLRGSERRPALAPSVAPPAVLASALPLHCQTAGEGFVAQFLGNPQRISVTPAASRPRRPWRRRLVVAAFAAAMFGPLGVAVYVASDHGKGKIHRSNPTDDTLVNVEVNAVPPTRLAASEPAVEGNAVPPTQLATSELAPGPKLPPPIAQQEHALLPENIPPTEAGFTVLYTHGDPLAQGWQMYGSGSIAEESAGVLVTHGGTGLLCYADRPFDDFILRLDYRTSALTSNSGVYFGIPRLPVTPASADQEAHEVQISGSGVGVDQTGADWGKQRADRLPPPGGWNALELTVKGEHCQVRSNGILVNEFLSPTKVAGYLGLHAWQARYEPLLESTVRYRNIRIKALVPAEPKWVIASTTKSSSGANLEGPAPIGNLRDARAPQADPSCTFAYRRRDGHLYASWTIRFRSHGFEVYDTHGALIPFQPNGLDVYGANGMPVGNVLGSLPGGYLQLIVGGHPAWPNPELPRYHSGRLR
jgi:serine/threonine protein kinase